MPNYEILCKKAGDRTPSITIYYRARNEGEAIQYAKDKECNNAYDWKFKVTKVND